MIIFINSFLGFVLSEDPCQSVSVDDIISSPFGGVGLKRGHGFCDELSKVTSGVWTVP